MKYRVKKDNFLWKKDAILIRKDYGVGIIGYHSIDNLYNMPNVDTEFITAPIVENSPEWFEPIEDTVWEAFTEKVEKAKDTLVRKMRAEWRNK